MYHLNNLAWNYENANLSGEMKNGSAHIALLLLFCWNEAPHLSAAAIVMDAPRPNQHIYVYNSFSWVLVLNSEMNSISTQFLAVQNSSLGDLVTHSLTHWVSHWEYFYFWETKSDPDHDLTMTGALGPTLRDRWSKEGLGWADSWSRIDAWIRQRGVIMMKWFQLDIWPACS